MRAYDRKVLLYATAILLAGISSGADARYWRHYGYHWYGRTWNGSRTNSDERQVEKQSPSAEPGSELRNQGGDFGAAIEQMIHACDAQVAELKNMPLDAVAETMNPTEHQRDALEQIRHAALSASETLAAACPKNVSANVRERLETLSRTLDAMATSLATLRPTFTIFYGSLNDEQKARLVAMTLSKDGQPHLEEKSRSRQEQELAYRRGNSGGDCQQWITYLKGWPIRQLEERTSLTDSQRATLYDLTAVIYRAAGKLGTMCHADDRFTPPGRLDARQEQLKALQESVNAISNAFSRFEDELTDSQKAQLRGVLNLASTAGQRSVRQ